MPGIKLQSVSFSYLQTPVLSNFSLTINPGDFLGITGTNGSGKSTLLYLLNKLIPHHISGKLTGKFVNDISSRLVFQNPEFSLFNLTVKEEILFGNPKANVASALKLVGLDGYADRDPQTLSFGQKQKVCLAAALAADPDYLLLDEPTAMLDYKSSVELYEILTQLNKAGKTIIVVEHDTDFLLKYCQLTLIIDSGKIKSFGPTKKVFAQKNLLKSLGIKIPHL